MNCQITVKGNGHGGYGHPKTDKTGPLKDFLVDNQVFYRAVREHLKTCSVCSVEEILRFYLDRRLENPKFEERSSSTLAKHAVALEKLAAKKKTPVPKELVNEFLWRVGVYGVKDYSIRLSPLEMYKAFRLDVVRTLIHVDVSSISPIAKQVYMLAKQAINEDLTEEEVEQLLPIVEIMST